MPTRREILQTLLASIGAGAVVPGLSAEHPLHRHAADPSAIDQAEANAAAREYAPAFLDRHQFDTLASLAERIVPGAARARASEFVDQLLAVSPRDDQRGFLNALGALEGEALGRARRPWKELAEADQIAILTDASTMASGRPPERPWRSGDPIPRPASPATPRLTLRDHFDLLKGWIAGAYYSSEVGMRELGWTGNVFYRTFPGCEHPGGHA